MSARPIALLLFLLPLFAACGQHETPGIDYSKCDAPSALGLVSANDAEGRMILLRGASTDIGLDIRDADGDPCDPSEVEISFDDPDLFEIVRHDDRTIVRANFDWFDLGHEPASVLRLEAQGLRIDLEVRSVPDLSGKWTVTVSEDEKFPQGYPFGTITFAQVGRRLTWEDCTVAQACGRHATVRDAAFTVEAPEVDLTLSVTISPDRRSFSGSWSAGSYAGGFTGTRPPE